MKGLEAFPVEVEVNAEYGQGLSGIA